MEYKNEPAFINRQEEITYIQKWLEESPKYILFFYGPKSSGKTTLIYKVVYEHLSDENTFSVKLFNLREVLLVNYEDFLQRFFQLEDQEEKGTAETRQYNLRVFRYTVQTQQKIRERQLDPFDVMKAELKDLNAQGIQPVIIIDELQALESIYFNSQRELIKELINFFVAMTKESHLCHVLLSSSDGYFIEKLYNDSKLRKTAKLFEIDYLPREDIVYWLNNLDKESNIREFTLNSSQIEYIWEHFGGSIWEISALLGDLLRSAHNGAIPDTVLENAAERYLLQAKSYYEEYAGLDDAKAELLREINTHVQAKGYVKEHQLRRLLEQGHYPDRETLLEELNNLVRNNFLYYNPTRAEYKLQGRSMEIGLARYVQEV
ncbi:ATP-binding protein [Desulfovermiculus halophilus]|uniref:ATP-binding protein n=1 Tax=Desulfovermiculus halophilus TaxID=339722 RepID=UPI000688BD14|nr:ATP-binding protein [Desulfovermiculus halophilus]